MRGLSIDPGGGLNRETGSVVAHCGWAEFENILGDVAWRCGYAEEKTANDCLDEVVAGVLAEDGPRWDWVAIEEWRLYAEQADRHVGSDFPTVQLIGALKHAVRWGQRKWEGKPLLLMQPASVKLGTIAVLRKRGIQSVAKAAGAGGHAYDAEVHGWAHLLRPTDGRKNRAETR